MRQSNAANLTVPTPEAMRSLGLTLGNALLDVRGAPLVINLRGELGTGKTTFVSGVLNAIGVQAPARSPTYTLIEPYETSQLLVYHLDLYRLADPREVDALGIRDLLTDSAVLLIEWPERGAGVLPSPDLEISLRYASASIEAGREVGFHAGTERGRRLLMQCMDGVK